MLAAGLLSATPAATAAPEYQPLTVQQERVVKGGPVRTRSSAPNPADERALRTPPPAPVWPEAGSVELPTAASFAATARAQRAGTLPVQVSAPHRTKHRPERVRVDVIDAATTKRSARDEVLLRVIRADGDDHAGDVDLAVDTRDFVTAYGAGWAHRLRLVELPDCALTTPNKQGCAGTPIPSTSLTSGWVTGTVTTGSLLALSAGASGPTGDFAATSLQPSATWSAGGNSGDFSWNYPFRVPPSLGGPSPDLALQYSAQSVDGRHAATNNQPSWIGEGFELWPGSIERRYKSCADDLGGNNDQRKTGDLCWATTNAILNLGSTATELIWDGSEYRPRKEDGSKIELLTGASNGDNNGEYWKVTTTDGTQYFFGRNRLPGWSSGKATTQSAWTVPVYGNNSSEPCHSSTFDGSHCQQAWRWNLDYVIDPHGNTMSFWYDKESNKYARNLTGSKVSSYTRGGTLDHIDYGTRSGTAYGTPPMRVNFTTADRCLSNCGNHGANWPDTPWDQECTSSTSCDDYSPTFWTTKRLATITTQVRKDGSLATVDTWTLTHTFPDPGDSTRAGLWLDAISRAGVPSDVKFVGVQLDNRVDSNDHSPPMKWWRIAAIRTEFGGDIGVTYSQQDCVAGSRMPSKPESNTLRCYPSMWTPQGYTDPEEDYFHKYVVERVDQTDLSGGGVKVSTDYDYDGAPAWHYTDVDGLTSKKYRTWSQWRGYELVKTYEGDGDDRTFTEERYFRGMHGDKLPSGTRTVSVTDSEDTSVTDHDAYNGMLREEIVHNGPDGPVVEATIYDPWRSAPTASRTIDSTTVHARYVDTKAEHGRIALDGGRGWLRTTVERTFDGYGMPTTINDLGDVSTPDDDRCTRNTYLRNSSKWLMTTISRSRVYALSCGTEPSSVGDVISDERSSFDGQSYGVAPTKGDVTTVDAMDDWANGVTSYYQKERAVYDVHGRVVESYDELDRKSTTEYTPATDGPVTRVVEKNPKLHATTTEFDPAWGEPTKITDPNGRITELSYDSLGQLTGVWLPTRSRANGQSPSMTFAYRLPSRDADGQADGVSAITTQVLGPNGAYTTSRELYDGLLRQRQTQAPAGDGSGGRVITDTFYDTAGRAYKANGGYYANGAPSTTLFAPSGGDLQIAAQTLTTFDGAGRTTAEILRRFGVEKWRTVYGYGGDRTDVTPPDGAPPTSTLTDARGQTTEVRRYTGDTPAGEFEATSYSYDRKGQLTKVTDHAKNAWTYDYDPRGRVESTTDPDKGTTWLDYTGDGEIERTTDSRGRRIAYRYDALGRKTAMFQGSLTGTKLAEWSYDTVTNGTGLLASATRFVGDEAYRFEVLGYHALGEPTSTRVTVPAAEGKLAGAYSYRMSYNDDGSVKATSLPAAGGLPREVLEYSYDDHGKPVELTTSINFQESAYVENTQYTKLGEPGVYTFARSQSDLLVQQGFTYDETTRRLIRLINAKETSVTRLTDATYDSDPAGNIVAIDDTASGDTQCFDYDAFRRLAEAWTPASGDCTVAPARDAVDGPAPYWHEFSYDATGNRTRMVNYGASPAEDETTTYNYPPATTAQPHTLLSTATTKGSGLPEVRSYGYDKAGNTTSRPGGQTLTWDAEGNLASVEEPGGTSSYVYDADGARLIGRDADGATLFLPDMELRLDSDSGTVSGTRFYTHNGSTVAQRDAGGVTWLLADHQGTPLMAVRANQEQQVVQRRQTPFGEPRGDAVDWPNERGFQNGAVDAAGTVHLGAREYDTDTGRFTSVDPLIDHGDAQQMQGYGYANSSPITMSDPDGLRPLITNSQRGDEKYLKKKNKRWTKSRSGRFTLRTRPPRKTSTTTWADDLKSGAEKPKKKEPEVKPDPLFAALTDPMTDDVERTQDEFMKRYHREQDAFKREQMLEDFCNSQPRAQICGWHRDTVDAARRSNQEREHFYGGFYAAGAYCGLACLGGSVNSNGGEVDFGTAGCCRASGGVGWTSANPDEMSGDTGLFCLAYGVGACYSTGTRKDGTRWHGGEVNLGAGVFAGHMHNVWQVWEW